MTTHQEVFRALETKINYAAKLLGERGWDLIEVPVRSLYKELPSAIFKQTFVAMAKRVNAKGLYLANEIGKEHLTEFAHVRLYLKYPSKPPRGCTCPRDLLPVFEALTFPASIAQPVREIPATRARVTGGITLGDLLQLHPGQTKPRMNGTSIKSDDAPIKPDVKPEQVAIFKQSKLVALKSGSDNQKCASFPDCFCC